MRRTSASVSVSVIIPAHRSTDPYMAETLASVVAQTVPPNEIIVVRDYGDRGPAWARNQAASKASGDWLLLLDADDTIDPKFIETAQEVIWSSTGRLSVVIPSNTLMSPAIMRDNYMPYCALVLRGLWNWLDGYQEPSSRGYGLCDWDFWIRCYLKRNLVEFGYIPSSMFHHRDRPDSMSKWSMDHFEAMRSDLLKKYGITP